MNKTTLSVTSALRIVMSFSTAHASSQKLQRTPAEQTRLTLKQIEESAVNAANEAGPLKTFGGQLSADSHYERCLTGALQRSEQIADTLKDNLKNAKTSADGETVGIGCQ